MNEDRDMTMAIFWTKDIFYNIILKVSFEIRQKLKNWENQAKRNTYKINTGYGALHVRKDTSTFVSLFVHTQTHTHTHTLPRTFQRHEINLSANISSPLITHTNTFDSKG